MEQDQPHLPTQEADQQVQTNIHREQHEDDDAQPDPALLAAMGFSSFGAPPKPHKRQKLDHSAFSANDAQSVASEPIRQAHSPAGAAPSQQQSAQTKELDALAKGVRDPNGDVAYFKPSFIEDPWRDLVSRDP